jgi:hypothetical protein
MDSNPGPNVPVAWAITDGVNPDSVYKPGCFATNDRGQIASWYMSSPVTASLTITMTEGTNRTHYAIAANYGNAPGFSEIVIRNANYTPADTANFYTGLGTGAFTVESSLVVSFVGFAGGGTPRVCVSDTGDTQQTVESSTDGTTNFALFYRFANGPGAERVEMKMGPVQVPPFVGDGNLSIATMVFSAPLPKQIGDDNNYGLRSGTGFDHNEPFFDPARTIPLAINRPLVASPPFSPRVGSLMFAFIGGSGIPTTGNPTLTDQYGNVYSVVVNSSGPHTGIPVLIFVALLSSLPLNEALYPVTLTVTPPVTDAPYQTVVLGLVEVVLPGLTTGAGGVVSLEGEPIFTGLGVFIPNSKIRGAIGTDPTNLDPDVLLATHSITDVVARSLMLSMAVYPGNADQDTVAWQALDDWDIRSEWNFNQYPLEITNRRRFAPSILMSKVAPIAGTYNARALATPSTFFENTGGIAMVAITMPSSLRLIKSVSGGTAVTTDWTLTATGPDTISGAGGVGPSVVSAGTYELSESSGPANYTPSAWSCTGGSLTGATLLLGTGQSAVCSITNTFVGSGPSPSPEFCIITPISTPPPSFVVYPEPEELKGS